MCIPQTLLSAKPKLLACHWRVSGELAAHHVSRRDSRHSLFRANIPHKPGVPSHETRVPALPVGNKGIELQHVQKRTVCPVCPNWTDFQCKLNV